jgi:hypothetical protein
LGTGFGGKSGLIQRHELGLVRSEPAPEIRSAKRGLHEKTERKSPKTSLSFVVLLWQQKLKRENQVKTEEHLEPTAVFIHRVTAAVSELKDHLQQGYERTYPDLGEIIRIVLDEEEAKAWELSFFPHLFLPDMIEAHIANLNLQPVEPKRITLPALM